MNSLNLSICSNQDQDTSVLQKLLLEFRDISLMPIQVNISMIPLESYRHEMTGMVIHNRVGDVSQAGAPVVRDLMAMNALRPFTSLEVEKTGGETAFVPVAWQSTQQISDEQVWSMPWTADPGVFLYWIDLLEQAGIDEEIFFQSPGNLAEASRRVQASGIPRPWGITAGQKHSAIHSVASWVWASGGDFLSEDGKRVMFMGPEALAGLRAYFSMIQFMAPESQLADYRVNNQLFINRQSAIISGNGEIAAYIVNNLPDEMCSRLGVALPFGIPLVGGSSLVVWANSRH